MSGITLITVSHSGATGVTSGSNKIVLTVTCDTDVGGVVRTYFTSSSCALVAHIVGRVKIVTCSALETVCVRVAVYAALYHTLAQVAYVSH